MKRLLLILTAFFAVAAYGQEPYSIRMIRSEMQRNPDATYLDGREGQRKWNYTTGLELKSFLDAAKRYELPEVVDYVRAWADTMATEKGEIYSYKKSNYNVDHICPARIYFDLHDMYGDQDKRYRRVTRKVREQLDSHPRTQSGEFWHKQVYPNQVWLDGFYMALPFYAEYTKRYAPKEQRDSLFADIAHQFTAGAKNTYDPATGLFRHAWDESRSMFWCDPETGLSEHAWGRATGWYAIALVEVLDYMPKDHPGHKELVDQLNYLLEVLPKWADPQTGMWYQVLDCPEREGNYQEATCSIMFTYAFLKGLRRGYIDRSHEEYILGLYPKFIDRFIRENSDGTISMTDCCAVGGLGGKQMRKGDFEYYLSEPIIENDCKGVGPFIWASLEWEARHNIDWSPSRDGQAIAFEGAEGCGKYSLGGRGGKEYVVTSLADDGSKGTLRYAVEAEGPRIVTFAVSGDIHLTAPLNIRNPYLTILGQTAPGKGITLRDHNVFITADHVIVRYLRMRLGSAAGVEADALGARHCRHLMIDHCSISWATDENASFYNLADATIQWCIISEALNSSVHHKGKHGYGGIWGGRNVSFHHNLFAHNNSRNPRFDHPRLYWENDLLYYRGTVEFVNNVVYNWGMKAIYGGEEGWFNVINNSFRPGPATRRNGEWLDISISETTSMIKGKFYIDGNEYDGTVVEDDRSESERFVTSVTINEQSAGEAYKAVLKHAGASHRRDAVDRRIIREVRKGTATFKGSVTGLPGIIDSETDVLK
ncbi:MAG: glycoside hydrolase family 88 protein [Bacteroidales bacterium]|nr:glycoside hydrolase family 88 protein [Bacteroidales bacterium]